MEGNYREEKKYLEAKKKVKQVKGFYAHALVNIISVIIIVLVNLKFSPYYHWFWFPVIGIVLVTFIHWMLVFGVNILGFGKDWEEKKIKEYLNKKD
ncbi:2TM domain-containing protein [Tenacibaculum mesophilum]|uniref:2TM domain-containing protein n=1 Tax=Tenacibaculum mesophilum TaxID=104268 RepID=UPI003F61446B